MWADFLIAIGIAVLLGVGIAVLVRRLGGVAGLERRRARSEAAAADPRHDVLSETEQEHVEAIHELVEKARTDEHPIVLIGGRSKPHRRVVRRPIGKRLAAEARHAARAQRDREAHRRAWDEFLAEDPLSSPLPTSVLVKPVMVPGPMPLADEEFGFTQGWTKADVERMVAEYKAGARS